LVETNSIDLVTVEPWEGHETSDRWNEKGIEGREVY